MLSLGLGSLVGSKKGGAGGTSSSSSSNNNNEGDMLNTRHSIDSDNLIGNLSPSHHHQNRARTLGSASASTSSSIRARSRSPSSSSSPLYQRRSTPNQLPTIPSASNIYESNPDAFEDETNHTSAITSKYSSSPLSSQGLYMNGSHETSTVAAAPGGISISKSRSSSLAPTGSGSGSAPRNIPGLGLQGNFPDSVSTGSPREGSRLYERGGGGGGGTAGSYGAGSSNVDPTSVFSSSFPSSGGIWGNDINNKTGTTSSSAFNINPSMPPPASANPVRTSLSRHLSLSGGNGPKTSIGFGLGGNGPGGGSSPSRANSLGSGAWPDSPLSVDEGDTLTMASDYRQGRPRTRMQQGGGGATAMSSNHQQLQAGTTDQAFNSPSMSTSTNTGAPNAPNHLARSLSIASDRTSSTAAGNGAGIAISNMSPFVRDLRGLPSVPIPNTANPPKALGTGPTTAHPYSSSFSTGGASGFAHRGPATGLGHSFGSPLGSGSGIGIGIGSERSAPANHGAVGSGRTASMAPSANRRRRDSFWAGERPLREGDEGAFYDVDEEDEDFAPPTRSGATSRRHSVAAFTSSSALTALTSPPAVRSQVGFQVPSEATASSSSSAATATGRSDNDRQRQTSQQTDTTANTSDPYSAGGSSRLDDDDLLAVDLSNALQINLEAHAARQHQEDAAGRTTIRRPTGLDSRSSSMPAHMGENYFSQSPPTHVTSPFGSYQPSQRIGTISTSPPRARPSGHDRRSSTSGDPYSPSASAARYLATAQHVQPPPLPPQTGSSPSAIRRQNHPAMPGLSPDPDNGLWPPSAANAFVQHQQSPSFRSGTLPPPDMLPNYSNQNPIPGMSAPAGMPAYSPFAFRGPGNEHGFGPGRGPSPSGHIPLNNQAGQSILSPRAGGFVPPFAGFPAASQMSGLPPPSLTTMNASAQAYFVPPIAPQPNLNDLGRGVPLHALPAGGPLYIVEFKAGRTDLFYVEDPEHLTLQKGDLVVVEADRGKDLGKCLTSCTLDEVRDFQMHQVESALGQLAAGAGGGATIGGIGTLPPGQAPSAAAIARMTKEIHPKKIYGRASPADVALLAVKAGDEQKALNVCRAKVAQHQLPMEVTDAEFQFDRRRLTFFYIADRRIDFRNLVKDLFRLYKTRIWLCAIEGGTIQR